MNTAHRSVCLQRWISVLFILVLLTGCGQPKKNTSVAPNTPAAVATEMVATPVVVVQPATQPPEPSPTRPLPKEPAPATTEPPVVETPTQVLPTARPEPSELVILHINPMAGAPNVLDPQKASTVGEVAVVEMIYEGLTLKDKNLNIIPGAAESWKYNDDATEVVFTLRKDLKYSDGSLLNAKRFEYALLRAIEEDGPYAPMLDVIKGAAAFREVAKQHAGDPSSVSIQAQDLEGAACTGYDQAECLNLRISLDKPTASFQDIASLWVAYPVKEELITKGGAGWSTQSQYQIGNGPFVAENLSTAGAKFSANPNYWRGKPYFDVQYSYYNSAQALTNYKSGKLDITLVGQKELPSVQADPELSQDLQVYPASCANAIVFNHTKEPFTDPKVRAAFAYAIDRQAYVKEIQLELGIPSLTWIPGGFPAHKDDETRWGFDAEKAKQALSESSYGSAGALPVITATYSNTPTNQKRWSWLAKQWETNLGVKVALNPVSGDAFSMLLTDTKTAPQMRYMGWCADYPDPSTWLTSYWGSSYYMEASGFSNPDFTAALEKAEAEINWQKRTELFSQAQDVLVDGAPAIFLYTSMNAYLIRPWIKDYTETPLDVGWTGSVDPLTIWFDETLMP